MRAGAAVEMLSERGMRKLCARVSEGVETVYAQKMEWVWRPRERGGGEEEKEKEEKRGQSFQQLQEQKSLRRPKAQTLWVKNEQAQWW